MRLVHLISGKENSSFWLSEAGIRLLHLIYAHPPKTSMEWSRLCCKAGVCPVILARSGLTYKAAS
ncbi:hypothetical protein AZI86_04255 [Bdellovibrio bacteriovorus]|uniref:Uncharacterized protein n=1 Tax=Bdellovibrio bacteriovorus TaxID=959 RepID=A0A150WPG0_BDEBC|nr:hypothetical protein [Bdellovibrio bacteriovorus]KYG66278.1 hypothetical protein AZI86_04255 [Bdellovibrio bacteriovorus]